ncbi:hypothetical protein [Tuwongella immobilis]|uniref:Knr4/Smi1-like domain-containing protein n=1 Tax=Tuwongella immobilis TaxID=692036 RepID=A0A6C2YUU6_9BACT|nr:hypothetical protein [Tuwongella immobilis]VIP05276.1 Uncharacterized protein OS=Escherichia coli KTE210 GN=A15U_00663 PE=4 SV=1 [Tuwongella immobilis]VTS07908.1 Uncharacterized protein OS=Escherichia coli KTE210 GN=A15U_00663 PE=4 SV=1 [Tuwongella immobilis]
MSFINLFDIVKPPLSPLNQREWSTVESRSGITFPVEFKKIVDSFGLGEWGEWVILFGPGFFPPVYDIEIAPFEILDGEREFIKDLTSAELRIEFPYSLWPEKGGLFPFGVTVQSDRLYWKTDSDPDKWPIVLQASRDTMTEIYHMSTPEFLSRLISGELSSTILPPAHFLKSSRKFRSFS